MDWYRKRYVWIPTPIDLSHYVNDYMVTFYLFDYDNVFQTHIRWAIETGLDFAISPCRDWASITLAAGDVDGDGVDELVRTQPIGWDDNEFPDMIHDLHVLEYRQDQDFEVVGIWHIPGYYRETFKERLAVGDLDGNGKEEIVLYQGISELSRGPTMKVFTYTPPPTPPEQGTLSPVRNAIVGPREPFLRSPHLVMGDFTDLPQTSSITIRKEANDDATAFNFTFDGQAFSLKNGQTTVFDQLTPGRYIIGESLPSGWLLREISCDNGLSLIDPEPQVTLELQPGQNVVCTFRNERTTAIELASFTAKASADSVTLAWETVTEIDNEGFNIWRSETADGSYVKLNPSLIPAQGNADTGASYQYNDTGVVKGTTYFYKLEDLDTSGVSTFHGPISATASPLQPIYLPLILKD